MIAEKTLHFTLDSDAVIKISSKLDDRSIYLTVGSDGKYVCINIKKDELYSLMQAIVESGMVKS